MAASEEVGMSSDDEDALTTPGATSAASAAGSFATPMLDVAREAVTTPTEVSMRDMACPVSTGQPRKTEHASSSDADKQMNETEIVINNSLLGETGSEFNPTVDRTSSDGASASSDCASYSDSMGVSADESSEDTAVVVANPNSAGSGAPRIDIAQELAAAATPHAATGSADVTVTQDATQVVLPALESEQVPSSVRAQSVPRRLTPPQSVAAISDYEERQGKVCMLQRNRGARWPELLEVGRRRIKNHYTALLELAGQTPETALQIEKDLPRTFAGCKELNKGSPLWEALKRVLTAFAAHDAELGYVQSMNFLAAFLLLAGVKEEEAFWCLVVMVEKVVPGYFEEGMMAAKVDQRVFAELLLENLPALGLHLAALGPDNIICGIIASQWLLTLFVHTLPDEVTACMWDVLFKEKSRHVLFAACLAVLEPHMSEILATTEMGECIELLQLLGNRAREESFQEILNRLLSGPLSQKHVEEVQAQNRLWMEWELAGADKSSGVQLVAPLFVGLRTPADELRAWLVEDQPIGGAVAATSASTSAPDRARETGKEDMGLQHELGEINTLQANDDMGELMSSSALYLDNAAMLAVYEHVLAADRHLRSLKMPATAFRIAVEKTVLGPLYAGASKILAEKRREIEETHAEFKRDLRAAIALGSKGLAWGDGNATLWSAWKGSDLEEVLLDAEEMMESLRSYIFELNAALGREGGREGGPHQSSLGLAIPKEDTARALAHAHAQGTGVVMEQLRGEVRRAADDARADLQVLITNNLSMLHLAACRASGILEATKIWEQRASDRRVAERVVAQCSLSGLQERVHTTLDIAVAGQPASPPTPHRLSREQEQVALGMHSFAYGRSHFATNAGAHQAGGLSAPTVLGMEAGDALLNYVDLNVYENELKQLENAQQAMEEASKVLRRRAVRVERQRHAASAVCTYTRRVMEESAVQKEAIERATALVRDVLVTRCSPEGRKGASAACAAVEAAAGVASALRTARLEEHVRYCVLATEKVVMSYIAAVDATLGVHSDIVDQVKAQVDSLLLTPSTQSQSQLAAARMGGGGVMPTLRSLQSLTKKLAAPTAKDDADGLLESIPDPEPSEAAAKLHDGGDPAGSSEAAAELDSPRSSALPPRESFAESSGSEVAVVSTMGFGAFLRGFSGKPDTDDKGEDAGNKRPSSSGASADLCNDSPDATHKSVGLRAFLGGLGKNAVTSAAAAVRTKETKAAQQAAAIMGDLQALEDRGKELKMKKMQLRHLMVLLGERNGTT